MKTRMVRTQAPLSATDNLGLGVGRQATLPERHCLQKKGKLEMDLVLVRGLGQAGTGFGCHSFSPEKCQPICIRANWGISQVNLPFHARSQGSTFRCPAASPPLNPPDRMTTQGPGKAGTLTHILTEALWALSGRGDHPHPGDLAHLSSL